MYITLINALKASGKPEEAIKAAEEGRAAFPEDKSLRDFVEGME